MLLFWSDLILCDILYDAPGQYSFKCYNFLKFAVLLFQPRPVVVSMGIPQATLTLPAAASSGLYAKVCPFYVFGFGPYTYFLRWR